MAEYEENGDPELEEGSDPQDDSTEDEYDDLDEQVEEDDDTPDLQSLRQRREDAELVTEEEEEESSEEEKTEEESEEEEEEAEPETEPKKKGNVHAALRVTERALETANRNNQILAARFNQLLEMVQSGQLQNLKTTQQQAEEVPEEEIPDFSEDPMGNIGGRMGKLEKLVERFVNGVGQKEQVNATQNALREIDNATVAYAQTIGPQNYSDAIRFLAQVKVSEEMVNYPNLTENEAVQSVAQRVINDKIRWASQGLNPGEQWIKQARNLGWKPGASNGKNKNTDPRQEVARKKEKNAKGSTISRAPGAAARKNLTVDDVLKYPERDWDTLMRRSAKAMGKKPNELKFSDIIPPMR